MATWGVLFLFFSVLTAVLGSHMQGGVMTFRYRGKNPDGSLTVDFKYKSSYRGGCYNILYWYCASGNCGYDVQRTTMTVDSGASPSYWCQSETYMVKRVPNDKPFQLIENSCCWIALTNGNTPSWSLLTSVDLGTRSDTSKPNTSPVTTIIPVLRVPQNCPSSLNLLAHDPDGDIVQCRYGQSGANECATCYPDAQFYLDQYTCSLSFYSTLTTGTYIFELVLEDFPKNNINLSYSDGTVAYKHRSNGFPNGLTTADSASFPTTSSPNTIYNQANSVLSKIPLQFVIEVYSSVPSCDYGQYRPLFLSPTPNNGDILRAKADAPFQLQISAQALQDSIVDFKVSGPSNMTKRFTYNPDPHSRNMTVEWTPSTDNIEEHVPFCFVAETSNGYHSEMRCLIVIVEHNSQLKTTLTCTDNTMTLLIDKSPASALYENHLRLNDPQCLVTSNSTHLIGSVGFNSCGTEIEETEDKIVFKNQITSFDHLGDVITRKQQVAIDFNCSFPKETLLSAAFQAKKAFYEYTEAGFGHFTYRFQLFQDNQFNTIQAQYPLEVSLRDMIYMEIQVTAMTPDVQLFVESCKATPHNNPNDPVFYDIIKNGCPKDDTFANYPGSNTTYRFGMEAFAFIGSYEEVYVSCTVILCKSGDPNTRCARGCVTSPHRRKRSLGSETQQHFISQGPLRLKREVSSERALDTNPALNMNTLVVAVAVVAVVAIIALAFHTYKKQTRYEKLPTEEL
ncbi:uncharacterized protein O3C94_021722 isoform 2-T2 [Discoglossus pictus]